MSVPQRHCTHKTADREEVEDLEDISNEQSFTCGIRHRGEAEGVLELQIQPEVDVHPRVQIAATDRTCVGVRVFVTFDDISE